MTDHRSTFRRIRAEARAVLLRVRALGRSAHDGGALSVDKLAPITETILAFAEQIEATAGEVGRAEELEHLLAAREDITEAQRLVLGFLEDTGAR